MLRPGVPQGTWLRMASLASVPQMRDAERHDLSVRRRGLDHFQ